MVGRGDVLDAMQQLVVREGVRPSIQAVARAVGLTKQGVLHHFPDRAALDGALVVRAVTRVDEALGEAARTGSVAEMYLRLSAPTTADRAAALMVVASMRTASWGLPPEVRQAMQRWQAMIEEEVGDPVRAEALRLVGDGLFSESLVTGAPPSSERIDRLVAFLLPDRDHDGASGS